METKKAHILVVDDSPASLQLIGKILKREGFESRLLLDGSLALASARREPPDLILLDIKMPGLDGYKVCELLKQDDRTRDIPVIFISALHESLDKVKAFSLGGVDFLSKPFDSEEAVARVRNHLKMRNLQIRLEKQNSELNEINLLLQKEIAERKRAEREIIKYQKKLRCLHSETTLVEERERSGIAADLHDNIGQQLALLKIKLGAMKEAAYANGVADVYDDVYDLAQQAIQTTRSLMFEISPVMLYELGFEPAVEWLLEKFQTNHGLRIRFQKDEKVKQLEERSMFQLFRTIRELLANIVKHSGTKNVRVEIRREERFLKIVVEDDGDGFDFDQYRDNVAETRRFGLFGIQEHMTDLGGRVEIRSEPGGGTKVTLYAPLDPSAQQPG